jgi:hypothetical protein
MNIILATFGCLTRVQHAQRFGNWVRFRHQVSGEKSSYLVAYLKSQSPS